MKTNIVLRLSPKTKAKTQPYRESGKRGGLSVSDAKREAARLNGAKGGRPRKGTVRPQPASPFVILSQCGGCLDMHKGIALLAKAHPRWSDPQLAEETGCSLTMVRQARTRYLAWETV